LHFVKNNLKLLLRLVSTDIHNSEVSLTANEFNSLRVLFKFRGQVIGTTMQKTLASMTPFYAIGAHTPKVHMQELQDWILANLEFEDTLGSSYKSLGQDAFNPKSDHITFLNKCVTVKDKNNLAEGIVVKI